MERITSERQGNLLSWRIGLLALLIAVIPFFTGETYYTHIAIQILFFAALAIAWDLVGGIAGQLSLGHAAFFSIGAYASMLTAIELEMSPLLSLPGAAVFAAVVALIIGYGSFRLRGAFFTMATIAFSQIWFLALFYFRSITAGGRGLSLPFIDPSPLNLAFASQIPFYYIAATLLVSAYVVHVLVSRSRLGFGLRAIRDDQLAAEASGMRADRLKLTAFVVSAAITAMVGVFYPFFLGFIDPGSVAAVTLSIQIAVIGIIGGRDHPLGGLIGAVLIIGIEQFTNTFLGSQGGISTAAYGILIVATVLLFPEGLIRIPRLIKGVMARRKGTPQVGESRTGIA